MIKLKELNHIEKKNLPPVRFELTTPGLRDQCSATELKRPMFFSFPAELIRNELSDINIIIYILIKL